MAGWLLIIVGSAIILGGALGWCLLKLRERDLVRLNEKRRLLGAPLDPKRWSQTFETPNSSTSISRREGGSSGRS